ncbi:bifunctional hydroxymethylpyrimidine kinase/phosphomethylpyrimidine kinase [Zunongwangia sp.]|uniref:bifunctional hydroxymethylpyrimidine kinase/phosphomethylpyrimidine kinase n=1 Tax=Zunongwangia sp. TaxID=1965325 RepID=UPI003AA9ABF8
MTHYTTPSVLTIAGFDGSGGAGIQADIKTFSALGCFATSVLTALPVQNTTGVKNIFSIPQKAVAEQIVSIFEDIPPKSIKIGMVHSTELVKTIVNGLKNYTNIPIVFDPVMVATSGHTLIEKETIHALKNELIPISNILTPNLDEAGILADMEVKTLEDMKIAGEKIMNLGCQSVLVKGGHLQTSKITSVYFDASGKMLCYEYNKIDTKNTHGSGCTLSSAIAAYIARGYNFEQAVKNAQEYVHQAVLYAKDLVIGKGNGPLNHFYNPEKLIKNEMV